MKKCPSCGQDNPSMYSHCEWCGRSIENVPEDTSVSIISKVNNKKDSSAKSKKDKKTGGAFSTAMKMLSVVAIIVLIACVMYLAAALSFSIIYYIGVCICIILAYLLNVFPSLLVGKKSSSVKIRTLLSAISLIAVAGAFVLAYLGIINS